MFLAVAVVVELNAQVYTLSKIVLTTVWMGVYAILMGLLLPATMAARETADACDEPFQSQIPKL